MIKRSCFGSTIRKIEKLELEKNIEPGLNDSNLKGDQSLTGANKKKPSGNSSEFTSSSDSVSQAQLEKLSSGKALDKAPRKTAAGEASNFWQSKNYASSPRGAKALIAADKQEFENRTAARFTRGMRARAAEKVYAEMLQNGKIWKLCSELLVREGKINPNSHLSIAQLSSMNLSNLRRGLGKLTASESAFFDRFTRQKFFATHFTNVNLERSSSRGSTLTMFSRKKLLEKKMTFDRGHTNDRDYFYKNDHGFVFFSLECGPQPTGLDSEYGKIAYRVPFDSPAIMQLSWGSLDDLIAVMEKEPGNLLFELSTSEEESAFRENCCRSSVMRAFHDDIDAYNDIFTGKDLIPGAALSIISQLRKLQHCLPNQDSPSLSERLLARSTPEEINGLLNSMYRPEIRVPAHFFSSDFKKLTNKDIAGMKVKMGEGVAVGYAGRGEGPIVMLDNLLWVRNEKGEIKEFSPFRLAPEDFILHLEKESVTSAGEPSSLVESFFGCVQEALKEEKDPEESAKKWLLDYACAIEKRPPSAKILAAPAIVLAASLKQADVLEHPIYRNQINTPGADGRSALMIASQQNNAEAIKFLIMQGADKNLCDSNGENALMLATANDNIEALTALLHAGVEKDSAGSYGMTPLIYAAQVGRIHALNVLLDAGANKDLANQFGATPLMHAACAGNIEVLKALLDAGANKDAKECEGMTALMLAIESENVLAVKTLIEAGADLDIEDDQGMTARDYAARLASKGNKDVLLVFPPSS